MQLCIFILQKATKDYYPNDEAYYVAQIYANIKLQNALHKCFYMLLQSLSSEEIRKLQLILKWRGGVMDSWKQATRKQNDNDNYVNNNAYIFF